MSSAVQPHQAARDAFNQRDWDQLHRAWSLDMEARPKPHVLDDATIARTKHVNGESLEWCDVNDASLRVGSVTV